jgi:hypothetical protein
METWPEIRAWRRSTRAALVARRLAVPRAQRQRIGSVLRDPIADFVRGHEDSGVPPTTNDGIRRMKGGRQAVGNLAVV